MTVWAIIPVKGSPESKSRLAAVLDERARLALVSKMTDRVLAAAHDAQNITHVYQVGGENSPRGTSRLADPGGGLNAATTFALNEAVRAGAARAVFVHADLPLLTVRDVELLAAAADGEIAIAPDRHGTGTNALSLPLPQAKGFSFAFGPDSFAKHAAEAARLGLKIGEVHSPGLSRDVDEPDDLADVPWLRGRAE